MRVPTIHLNGTSHSELAAQFDRVSHALCEAVNALVDASPNGRDYYPQGPTAMKEAVAEHDLRVKTLQNLRQEIEAIQEAIADAEGGS